ncbi:Rv2231c family pyridoxal phosphate-dependent protein CobC [Allokutzneria sp. A3M-2-11 16]|uniref:Rv2231c family pyridoxal phosphate-dependent protein CobC n=1 Tax=Allokutzneria sp. A3M-2-11 16 TaxID=2962043 RepID=UPI0020B713F7|nr:Rv2231c family pyridoxal phosphate-dependent protein CobC [Allokutzneria sp. A3M-2-11 16]MCP3801159.1 Rv2231c family pyridoxal phosphate-dependent protein CobC [Allokutzneria sp. A3M-2-11 16]
MSGNTEDPLAGSSMDVDRAALRHHGDVEAQPGLADFAVNVRADRPPRWLRDRLVAALDKLGRYPSAQDDADARASAAARHSRRPDEVMVLNGAAEGFALLPALKPRLAAVIHPSFTEPEVALTDADVPVVRVLLDDHTLASAEVPDEADLVVIGNPTNPTSVLHPADAVRALARPGRVLVVDEAFADTIPGEPESLAGDTTPGLLVLRSLTKTWSLPGLRAGYALGAPELLARLGLRRPQWPVNALVLEAVRACCEPGAVAEAEAVARALEEHRARFAKALGELPGVTVAEPARAPFLLLHVPGASVLRERLRTKGFAVRRADTFPGLTPDHLRVAVRAPDQSAPLLAALRELLEETTP